MLILYTKNLELSIYHCKRGIEYYIEFIAQIGDNTNTYLKSFVWWPPTLTLFGGKGYIVLIDYN